ncbi:MAG TPA: MFS transporter [Tepidisphaeraceae bacterium]|jgi:MFS family permease|nr:MFS transporter [Tepidisphaeraceae bacterium]
MSASGAGTLDYRSTEGSSHDKILFWGCFIALITTAFGFIARMFLINTWATEFGLDPAQAGRLAGIGIWPFAASIIGFSLIIDKIGYKVAMVMAFLGHILWAVMATSAFFISKNGDKHTAYQMLYWGSLILALANGTVEAFINPVVATMFSREKTKWLNILHAGWPGGLVLAGIVTIFMGNAAWWIKVGILAVPAIIYFIMLLPLKFPMQEREAAGVSYREMLAEFGVLGAAIVGFLLILQFMDFFSGIAAFQGAGGTLAPWAKWLFIAVGVAIVLAFGAYTRSLGRPFLFFMILIMIPLATTEIGTDGWITSIMEGVAAGKFHPGWVLVYTSIIMVIMRFFAGPIVHAISPLGLLAVSAGLAIIGLYTLSFTAGMAIFVAATVYGFGKTFFWPTMLGVVSEQTPKGGAMTLNAISGIGMLAVGVLGFPYIGALQADKKIEAIAATSAAKSVPGLVVAEGKLSPDVLDDRHIYEVIHYKVVNDDKLNARIAMLPSDKKTEIASAGASSSQRALKNMAVFPGIMLVGYIILIGYFVTKGGYKAQVLTGHGASDDKFTGGVPSPVR